MKKFVPPTSSVLITLAFFLWSSTLGFTPPSFAQEEEIFVGDDTGPETVQITDEEGNFVDSGFPDEEELADQIEEDFNEIIDEWGVPTDDGGISAVDDTVENEAPIADDGSLILDLEEQTEISFSLANGISDPDSDDALNVVSITADNGTITPVEGSPLVFIYTPNDDFLNSSSDASVMDSIHYSVSDSEGADSGVAEITVEVLLTALQTNQKPEAENEEAETYEGESVRINVLDNDTDPDGQELKIDAGSLKVTGGTAVVDNGEIVFTPSEGFVSAGGVFGGPIAEITYRAEDPFGAWAEATVSILVRPIPNIKDKAVSVKEDERVTISLEHNYGEFAGVFAGSTGSAGLTASIIDGPSNGYIPEDNLPGEFVYEGYEDFNGTDHVTIEVCDGNGRCDQAVVTITVTPVADPPELEEKYIFYTMDKSEGSLTIESQTIYDNVLPSVDEPGSVGIIDVTALSGTIAPDGKNFVFTPPENADGLYYVGYTVIRNGLTARGMFGIYVEDFQSDEAADRLETVMNANFDIGEESFVEDLSKTEPWLGDFFDENPDILEDVLYCSPGALGHDCDDFAQEAALSAYDVGVDTVSVAHTISIIGPDGVSGGVSGHVVTLHKIDADQFCLDEPQAEGNLIDCFTIGGDSFEERRQDLERQVTETLEAHYLSRQPEGSYVSVVNVHMSFDYTNIEAAENPSAVDFVPPDALPVPPFGLSDEVWATVHELLFIGAPYEDYPEEFWE